MNNFNLQWLTWLKGVSVFLGTLLWEVVLPSVLTFAITIAAVMMTLYHSFSAISEALSCLSEVGWDKVREGKVRGSTFFKS